MMQPSTQPHGIGERYGLDIVDAQLHVAWEPGIDQVLTAMDALGVRSVILDEFWGRDAQGHSLPGIPLPSGGHRPLTPLSEAAALRHPERCAWLRRVTRRDPALAAVVAQVAAAPGGRALRVVALDPAEAAQFGEGAYDELFALAQEHGLPLCMLVRDAGRVVGDAARRFPRLRIVVDHCGWVRKEQHWLDVLELARLDNVWLKWSHACRAFGGLPGTQDGRQREFERALRAFGAQRLLWASDITHEESGMSWAQLLAFVQYNAALSPGELEWVLGGTARRVFDWPLAA